MSFILAPFPFINLRASPLEFTNFNILSASINLISKFPIIALGNALSVITLLNVFAAAFEIRSASSSLLHNLVTSLAKIILASFISAPFNFSSLLISIKGSSVNNFKNFITSGSSVFLQRPDERPGGSRQIRSHLSSPSNPSPYPKRNARERRTAALAPIDWKPYHIR